METNTIGTEETGEYGAGHEKFAVQGDGCRAIIEFNVEAEDEESAKTFLTLLKGGVLDVEGETIGELEGMDVEDTTIPTGTLFAGED